MSRGQPLIYQIDDDSRIDSAAVSYETVRRWVNHFGRMIAADFAWL
jgi:hypothetical protein